MDTLLIRFLTKYRGWVNLFLAVPISFIVNRIQAIRNWYFRTFITTNTRHDKQVAEIQHLVKSAYQNGQKMCTARKPWKTMSLRVATFKKECAQIPINLKNILALNTETETVRVEPMVTMGDMTHYLVPKGYALAVQVEMDDLTIGGLCMGVGIETTSHRRGFLFETIVAYEIVTSEGKLVRATKDENSDLFYALPWSHGTLGFLVAVELKVVPVKSYMKLKYIPCHDQASFCQQFKALSESPNPPSYLEGLTFSPEKSVIMCGEMVERDEVASNIKINKINRWYKKWFYSHVESFLTTGEGEELIPLRHYFHRHTPSVFFQLKDLIPFGNNTWCRWLFAWMGAPKISLMKLTYTKELRRQAMFNRVTQDIIVPMKELGDALNFSHKQFQIYPIWVCPVRLYHHGEQEGFIHNPVDTHQFGESSMYVDVGIYGIPRAVEEQKPWDMISVSREFEHFTANKKGFHLLYADIFMNRQEFREMFNHNNYEKVRAKYHADKAFPEVYEKVSPEKWLIDISKIDQAPETQQSHI